MTKAIAANNRRRRPILVGVGGFHGLLLRSVSSTVAAHAPCPVVVVHAHGDGTAFPASPIGRIVVGVDGSNVVHGHPAQALIDSSAGAELLVVGSHGHGGLAGMLLGRSVRRSRSTLPAPSQWSVRTEPAPSNPHRRAGSDGRPRHRTSSRT